jgi:hypothetical protein
MKEGTKRTASQVESCLNANGFPFTLHTCNRELAPDESRARCLGELCQLLADASDSRPGLPHAVAGSVNWFALRNHRADTAYIRPEA